eukprot:11358702-Ditylum_brightwellii.AAC.1
MNKWAKAADEGQTSTFVAAREFEQWECYKCDQKGGTATSHISPGCLYSPRTQGHIRGHGGCSHGRGRGGCGGRATSGSDVTKPQLPKAGESHTKMVYEVEHHWCGHCAAYKPDH